MKKTKPFNLLKIKRFSFFIILFLFVFLTLKVNAQESSILSNASISEKIYLQLDKDIYTTSSTIWFKAIVTKSFDNIITDFSNVLYVELIDANQTIIEKKLIKIDQGIGEGYFDVHETFVSGTYLIRAYTEWNKNFDTDFFFESYIKVFSAYDNISNEYKQNTQETNTANQNTLPETIILKEQVIDLQFLPESGELVHGLSSKVGFKALDTHGYGIPIEGIILDNENKQLATFKSNSLGMGSFQLDDLDHNKTYFAKLSQQSKLYSLPKVASLGNMISVSETNKIITINTVSNYLKNDTIHLNVSFRGVILHDLKAKLINGNLKFLFSSNELPEGILVFKMMDNFNRTVAERLYFNKRLENHLNLKISTDKSIYSKRELTNINIEAVNKNGEPINTNTSVLVINKQELGDLQNSRENIRSYFLLSSELKGSIENPGAYFNNNKSQTDIDALMLTQGWRHYKYAKPFETLTFKPEISLTVSGTAINKSFKNKGNLVDLTMMTFGKEEVLHTQTTDSLGKFYFDLDDEYGSILDILIQSTKKSGKKVEYDFKIDEKKSPLITFNHQKSIEKHNPIIENHVEKDMERFKKMEGDFYLPEGNIALDEVVLTGRNLNAAQQKVIKRFGEPDKIIDGKELQEKEKKWHSGIFDILHYSFPDKVRIVGRDSIKALNLAPTMVVVDGVPVFPYEYGYLQNIPASEVTSIEVIELAKFYVNFCVQIYASEWEKKCRDSKSGQQGNIIAIYTKAGIGIHGAYQRKPKGITNLSVPVFSETKVFYTPKYDKPIPKELDRPDLRTVIHWQPILKTDDSGMANASFYNADVTGDMLIIVEAITEDGEISYQELTYKVE